MDSGSAIPSTSRQDFYALTVQVPPLSEQYAIAEILGALDDKIELNRRLNGTLEAIAQALFQSWFVDFDPVRAKAAGRAPAGLDAATAALFPDGFEESALGPMPRGWATCALGDVAQVNARSIAPSTGDDVIEYVDISSVSSGRINGTSRYRLADAPSRARRIVAHGDTIWSTVRPNLKAYSFIDSPPNNLIVSTGFAVLTPVQVPSSYLYAWVTTNDFVDYLVANADGSAYPAVRADRITAAPVLLPPYDVLTAFERQAGTIRDLIMANDRASTSLAATRDALLPKLLSGEIRVPSAALTEEADG